MSNLAYIAPLVKLAKGAGYWANLTGSAARIAKESREVAESAFAAEAKKTLEAGGKAVAAKKEVTEAAKAHAAAPKGWWGSDTRLKKKQLKTRLTAAVAKAKAEGKKAIIQNESLKPLREVLGEARKGESAAVSARKKARAWTAAGVGGVAAGGVGARHIRGSRTYEQG